MFRMFRLTRSQEKATNQALAVVLLSVLLIINAGYFYGSLQDEKEYTGATLLFLNILGIVLIFGIIAIRYAIDTDCDQLVKLIADFLVASVATCVACSWLISLVYVLNYHDVADYQVSFLSSMLVVIVFGYYVFFKDHT